MLNKLINRRLIIMTALSLVIFARQATAQISKTKAVSLISSKQSCVFAASSIVTKSSMRDFPVGTLYAAHLFPPAQGLPVLCVFDGVMGKGVNQKSGCIVGALDLASGNYLDVGIAVPVVYYGQKINSPSFMVPNKCDKESVKKLLTKMLLTELDGKKIHAWEMSSALNNGGNQRFKYKQEVLVDAYGVAAELKTKKK